MEHVVASIRALLKTFDPVTAAVGDRIRPDKPDSSDGDDDSIIIMLPDADQENCLSGEGIVNGDLIIRGRSRNKTTASHIGELVRINTGTNGLDGYSGAAGTGQIIQCERVSFSEHQVDDEDADDNGIYEADSLYSLWFQTN